MGNKCGALWRRRYKKTVNNHVEVISDEQLSGPVKGNEEPEPLRTPKGSGTPRHQQPVASDIQPSREDAPAEADPGESVLSRQSSGAPATPSDVSAPVSRSSSGSMQPNQLKVFMYRELLKATANFKEPDMVLGEGGFGKVYKGFLRDPYLGPDPFPVAVKRLNPESIQGQQEWLSEIILLGKLRHPNLVNLIGYSADRGEGMLVYEFMPRGSLDYHLFPDEGDLQPPLPWETRLRIALDSAMGLAYLHDNHVIHRDFKAPNILLGEHWGAKLTDFGLAKGADSDQTHVTTRIMGTLGYLDPKYMETGQLTKKSDVFAFGVMLLELLTGRRAVDPDNQGAKLTAWAKELLVARKQDILRLVDPRLHDQFESRSAKRAAQKVATSAKHCIEEDPNLRPWMSDMVETLRPLVEVANRAPTPTADP